MEAAIEDDTQLNFIEFQIFPSQNRYEALVSCANKKEQVASGLLEHLSMHSPEAKALNSKGSDAKYKLTPPECTPDIKWFTKSTLIRFLHIISSPNILGILSSLNNEISQLEEARNFHLSLYAKGTSHPQSEESDDYCNGLILKLKAERSDTSKNELLRAIDLRLVALEGELAAAFSQVTGSTFSVGEMTNLEIFFNYFGSTDLRDSLHKHIEFIGRSQVGANLITNQFLGSDGTGVEERNTDIPVRYGVSPAKVAELERLSSAGSDESCSSSEDEQPSAQRSRSVIRSASPRRSASPMRRIQIGRSGSRRSAAITIKSLNSIPAREKSFLPNDSDGEVSEQARKKPETNAIRMSVQAAISLFESKQKDQTVDVQKARSLLNVSAGANKSVLRRWSSGMGEHSSQCPQDIGAEDAIPQLQDNSASVVNISPVADAESDCHPIEQHGSDTEPNSPEDNACSRLGVEVETLTSESTTATKKLTDSAEWSRQKEAELNELLVKMMETKPARRKIVPDNTKRQSLPTKQRGGFYDNYKEKRDEKLRGETAKTRAEKDEQFKAKQKVFDASKSHMNSAANTSTGKKKNVNKLQKSPKRASLVQLANPKTESPKPGIVKKPSVKAPSMPVTRKSLPSMPSTRAPGGLSPAKTSSSITSNGTTQARRRSPVPTVSRLTSKSETPAPETKSVKAIKTDVKKTLKSSVEKKQQPVTKSSKIAKSKVQTASEDSGAPAKPSLYSKVTKKGSVVPLESKPFLRKGSGTFPSGNAKIKASSQTEEQVKRSEHLIEVSENETISIPPDPVIQHPKNDVKELKSDKAMDLASSAKTPSKCKDENFSPKTSSENPEKCEVKNFSPATSAKTPKKFKDENFSPKTSSESPEKCEVKNFSPAMSAKFSDKCKDENFSPVKLTNNDVGKVVERDVRDDIEEESTISPTAWVEIEDHEDPAIVSKDDLFQMDLASNASSIRVTSPRVRHSLSQMLLEESSESDIVDWGNAENPPHMLYQKDAPKGFKRLLKFARKSKADASSTGWSSSPVFSEGEDDTEDSKLVSKRSAENLVKKATLQSTTNNYESYQKNMIDFEHPGEANITRIKSLSQQLQEGHASAGITTSKATRSFFSLSAFKGAK